MSSMAERLKEARIKKGFKLDLVKTHLKITTPTLIKYENGTVSPQVDMLKKMCDYYGVSLNYVVFGNENGIDFKYDIQKVSEVLASLFLNNKIKYDEKNKTIQVQDKDIDFCLKYLSFYINNEAADKENLMKFINNFINNVKQ